MILKFNQISQRYMVKLISIKTFILINKKLQLLAVFHWLASPYMYVYIYIYMCVCVSLPRREVARPIRQVEHWCRALLSIMHARAMENYGEFKHDQVSLYLICAPCIIHHEC